MLHKRHPTILQPKESIFVLVDYQAKMVNAMAHAEEVTQQLGRLIAGLNDIGVPVVATEQYPNGLGRTHDAITHLVSPKNRADKMTFSCCGNEAFWDLMQAGRRQVIVAGIETHVCVLQTVLDLLANDYQVHVPIDAVDSRSERNRDNALNRMQQAGAILTNSESVLFELMVEAGTDLFKTVRKHIV
mgnify:CR=1 FL=1